VAKEIFTSNVMGVFRQVSDTAARYGACLQLVRILGPRWSYVAGEKPSSAGVSPVARVVIHDGAGLVIYNPSKIPDVDREVIIESMKSSFADENVFKEDELHIPQIVKILSSNDDRADAVLFSRADSVRKKYMGDEVHLRGIVEFSNFCAKDCLYCGLRVSNKKLTRYKMEEGEIIDSCRIAKDMGCGTVVLQSGEAAGNDVDGLCRIVGKIKKDLALAVTVSIGELSKREYLSLKSSGADRYLLKFETSDRGLFKRLKPDGEYDKRFESLRILKDIGFQVGSGIMIGLPGQTPENIAEDIMMFKKLDLDMIGIGPFIPHPDTPLNKSGEGDLMLVLKVIALTRIITRNAHIPATTAIGSLAPDGRKKALQCGANVIMPNMTPRKYRKLYQLYPNKICTDENPSDCVPCIGSMLSDIGRTIARGHGHSLKRTASL